MDMNAVKGLVAEKPVVIFSRSQCSMSYTVKTLISSFGANPTVYELDEIPNGHQIETLLLQLGCQPCVPAIFIGQKLIGGARELMSLQVRNELMPLLMSARAIWCNIGNTDINQLVPIHQQLLLVSNDSKPTVSLLVNQRSLLLLVEFS
ncbi:hypothetical protein Csa_016873 [Cucumis sativus]|nr:hypothetical protein Csa_016873 [Cucumis sativus]